MFVINYDPVLLLIGIIGAFLSSHGLLWYICRTGRSKTRDFNPPIHENFKGYHVYVIALNCCQGFDVFPQFQSFLILHGSRNSSHQIHICRQGTESSLHLVRSVGTTLLIASTAQCLGEIQSITLVIRGKPGRWRLQWIQIYDKIHTQMWKFCAPDNLYITTLRTIYNLSTYLMPKRYPLRFHNWKLVFHPNTDDVHITPHERINIFFVPLLSSLSLGCSIPLLLRVFGTQSMFIEFFTCLGTGCFIICVNTVLDFMQHLSRRPVDQSLTSIIFWESTSASIKCVTSEHVLETNTQHNIPNDQKVCICKLESDNLQTCIGDYEMGVFAIHVFPVQEWSKLKKLLFSKKLNQQSDIDIKGYESRRNSSAAFYVDGNEPMQKQFKSMTCKVAVNLLKTRKCLFRDLAAFDASSDCSEISSVAGSFPSAASVPSSSSSPFHAVSHVSDRHSRSRHHLCCEIGGISNNSDIKTSSETIQDNLENSSTSSILQLDCSLTKELEPEKNDALVALTEKEKLAVKHIHLNIRNVESVHEMDSVVHDSSNILWIPRKIEKDKKLEHWIRFFEHWRSIQKCLILMKENLCSLQSKMIAAENLVFLKKLQTEMTMLMKIMQAEEKSDVKIKTMPSRNISCCVYERTLNYLLKNLVIHLILISLQHWSDSRFNHDSLMTPSNKNQLFSVLYIFCCEITLLHLSKTAVKTENSTYVNKENILSSFRSLFHDFLVPACGHSKNIAIVHDKSWPFISAIKACDTVDDIEKPCISDAEYNPFIVFEKSETVTEVVKSLTEIWVEDIRKLTLKIEDRFYCLVLQSNKKCMKESREKYYNLFNQMVRHFIPAVLGMITPNLEIEFKFETNLLHKLQFITSSTVDEMIENSSNCYKDQVALSLMFGNDGYLKESLKQGIIQMQSSHKQGNLKTTKQATYLSILVDDVWPNNNSLLCNSLLQQLHVHVPSIYNKLKISQKMLKVLLPVIEDKNYSKNRKENVDYAQSASKIMKNMKKSIRAISHSFSHLNSMYCRRHLADVEIEAVNSFMASKLTSKKNPALCKIHAHISVQDPMMGTGQLPVRIEYTTEELINLQRDALAIPKPIFSETTGLVARSVMNAEIIMSVLITLVTGFVTDVLYTFILPVTFVMILVEYFISQVIKSHILSNGWKRPVKLSPHLYTHDTESAKML